MLSFVKSSSCQKRIACWLCVVALFMTASSLAPAQQPLPAEGDEASLLAVIGSDADTFEKGKACQQLAVIGSKNAVPALVPLLADETLAHYARFALEPMDDPSVDRALRDALGRLEGSLLVGVIDSIGMRRDAGAVDRLVVLLDGEDANVAGAAAAALGRIATDPAVAALRRALQGAPAVRPAAADACLVAAEALTKKNRQADAVALYKALGAADVAGHVRTGALLGLARSERATAVEIIAAQLPAGDGDLFAVALKIAHETPGDDVTSRLLRSLDGLPSSRQALLIRVLGDRGDKAALPTVLHGAEHDDVEIRLAAVDALSKLGDATAVPVLLEAALNEPTEDAALASLVEIQGPDVDQRLAELLLVSDGARRLLLIRLVGARGIASAVPTLMTLADSSEAAVQLAAIQSLGRTIRLGDYADLVQRMLASRSASHRNAIKEALEKASQRMSDRQACAEILLTEMKNQGGSQNDLLDLLGIVGGAAALEGVTAAASAGDESVQDAATRVLGQWASPDAAPALLKLAKNGNEKFRTRCLRGYIRVIRQFGLPDEQRLAMCHRALDVAARADERRLVLQALPRFPSPEALQLALSHVEDSELNQAAVTSAVAIAEKIVNTDPAVVAEAMKKVIVATENKDLENRAKVVLDRAAS